MIHPGVVPREVPLGAHDLLPYFSKKNSLGARPGCLMTYAPYSYQKLHYSHRFPNTRMIELTIPLEVSDSETP